MDLGRASGVDTGDDHTEFYNQVKLFRDDSLSVDEVERVLDHVYNVSEEDPSSRDLIRDAGIVLFMLNVLDNNSKTVGSRLRSKTLMTLLSLTNDEESRVSFVTLISMLILHVFSVTNQSNMLKCQF